MIFRTQSGSQYEINTETKQVRRMLGKIGPTTRQGQDLEWKTYDSIFPDPITVGSSVIIFWPKEIPLLDDTPKEEREISVPTTMTSNVVDVIDEQTITN